MAGAVPTRRGLHGSRLSERRTSVKFGAGGDRAGEFRLFGLVPIAARMPWLIWVHDLVVGDVMVDGSTRGERLRPLGLWWVTARGREPRDCRERAGRFI